MAHPVGEYMGCRITVIGLDWPAYNPGLNTEKKMSTEILDIKYDHYAKGY